jgi:nitroimidazol reductase NimA-like FMN-containing flavoprotein (pyridoxamine 5'-phosphate oxidase superfamily)
VSDTTPPADLPADTDPAPPASDRVRLRRKPMRGRHDRETVDAIIDASIIGVISFVQDGQPYGIPTNVWREGDRLYWHASAGARLLRAANGNPVCVTLHHVDALVLARSATNHSVNYRSVVVLGTAHLVTDVAHAEHALEGLIESIYPGRWAQLRPMTEKERKETGVMYVDLAECSAKVRDEGPHDNDGDETWPVWAGLIPVQTVRGAPEPDEFVAAGTPEPVVRVP